MNFRLFIITPTYIFFDGEVKSVSVRIDDGLVQFLANHMEEMAGVVEGIGCWTTPDDQKVEFCTAGGVFYFRDNTAYLMTEHVAYQKDWDDKIEARANYLKQEQSRRKQSIAEHRLSAIALTKAFGAMRKNKDITTD